MDKLKVQQQMRMKSINALMSLRKNTIPYCPAKSDGPRLQMKSVSYACGLSG